ncbi:MAG: hypothetical protein JWO15_2214 [Sphingomonadales bacterium]|nr:hypothetical protein [Sphingomonadales bacterium]
MIDYKFVVLTNAVPGREEEFDRWYDEQHLADVLAIPGFKAAQRAQIAEGTEAPYRFCTIYDISSEDIAATMADLESRANTDRMPLTDAMSKDLVTYMYETRGAKRIA